MMRFSEASEASIEEYYGESTPARMNLAREALNIATQSRYRMTSTVERNLELMKTLDNAWNAGPGSSLWETFRMRHTENVAVYWPGQPEPTRGRHNHDLEAVEFFKTFPDNHLINNPYKILFGQDDWTCSVADFYGTFKGPMKTADGKVIPPTNKGFHVEFCTVAHWNDKEEIIEERLFYDLVGLMKQIGLG